MVAPAVSRETWMQACIQALSSWMSALGADVPPNIRAGCGWPAGAGESNVRGACYSPDVSKDGTFEIFVSPSEDVPLEVASILAHEISHAAMGMEEGHGPKFAALVRSIGLEGPPTATKPGAGFKAWFDAVSDSFGAYPHAAMTLPPEAPEPPEGTPPPPRAKPRRIGAPKPQKGRLLKAACACGYTVRVTRIWLDKGAPICPLCRASMTEC